MSRPLSIRTVFSKKFITYGFSGIWKEIFGDPEKGGVWIVYGPEKHGKTWFALLLANYISQFEETWYISAEEGLNKDFVAAMNRAKLNPENRQLKFRDYTPLENLIERLDKRNPPKVVLVDNVTVYKDELAYGGFTGLIKKFPETEFIFLAHEDKNEPYTATAKMIKRFAKIIVRVEGLAVFVSGRCPGGTLTIDESKAALYHGTEVTENTEHHENLPIT